MNNEELEIRFECVESDVAVTDIERKRKRKWKVRSITAQLLATFVKNTIHFEIGNLLGFTTLLIAAVHNAPPSADLSLTDDQVTWIGSITFIAYPIGCIFSGAISRKFGRKRTMMIMAIPQLSIWLIFYYANSFSMILTAAIIAGLTAGLTESPVFTYISEISEPYLRGLLATTSLYANLFGMFLLYLFGTLFDWRTLSIITTLVPISSFIALYFVPESPYWLIGKKRFAEAERALCWLRGWTTKEHIEEEFNQLVKGIRLNPSQRQENNTNNWKSRIFTFNSENYKKRTFIIPFMLLIFTAFLFSFVGGNNISPFAVNIFKTFGAPIDAYYATAIFGLSRILGSVTFQSCIRFTGRRPLVFSSGIGLCVVCVIIGCYGRFYLGIDKLDNGAHVLEHFGGSPNHSWLPTLCLILFPFISNFGIGILIYLLMGEVYPTNIREFSVAISGALYAVITFILQKTFLVSISGLTLPGLFLLYAVVLLGSVIIYYFVLPETEGWSLTEIEEHFAGKRNLVKAGKKKTDKSIGYNINNSSVPMREVTKL